MWILYNYGGLYFDTDVELIKPIDDIIARGNFMGREVQMDDKVHLMDIPDYDKIPGYGPGANPGVGLGIAAGHPFLKEILSWYKNRHFVSKWGKIITPTIVGIVSDILKNKAFERYDDGVIYIADIFVYPSEFFSPKNYATNKLTITDNTRSIHHFASTWTKSISPMQKIRRRILGMFAYFSYYITNPVISTTCYRQRAIWQLNSY